MFRELWRNKILILFLLALIILFPIASVKPAQMLSKTLFLSIGIDKDETGYQVGGIVVENQFEQTAKTSTKFVGENSASVTSALNKITTNQGREISLAHCNLIIVGAGLKDDNLAYILDYFIKKYELSNTALLVYTDGDIKTLQETSIENKTGASAGMLETIAAFNQQSVFGQPLTLEQFYKDYLRASSSGIIAEVALADKAINNSESAAVFKNGKFSLKLEKDQMRALSFLHSGPTKNPIVLENVNGGNLDNAQVTLQISSKNSRTKTKIKNGVPHVDITINTTVRIDEISSKSQPQNFLDFTNNPPRDVIETAFALKLKTDLVAALDKIKIDKTDFMRFYDTFYRCDTAAFKQYMKNKTIDEFLSEIEYSVEVSVKAVV